jgi:hypothetical protein
MSGLARSAIAVPVDVPSLSDIDRLFLAGSTGSADSTSSSPTPVSSSSTSRSCTAFRPLRQDLLRDPDPRPREPEHRPRRVSGRGSRDILGSRAHVHALRKSSSRPWSGSHGHRARLLAPFACSHTGRPIMTVSGFGLGSCSSVAASVLHGPIRQRSCVQTSSKSALRRGTARFGQIHRVQNARERNHCQPNPLAASSTGRRDRVHEESVPRRNRHVQLVLLDSRMTRSAIDMPQEERSPTPGGEP